VDPDWSRVVLRVYCSGHIQANVGIVAKIEPIASTRQPGKHLNPIATDAYNSSSKRWL
jgi:hypothetical protein